MRNPALHRLITATEKLDGVVALGESGQRDASVMLISDIVAERRTSVPVECSRPGRREMVIEGEFVLALSGKVVVYEQKAVCYQDSSTFVIYAGSKPFELCIDEDDLLG